MAERRSLFLLLSCIIVCWLLTSCSSSSSPTTTGGGGGGNGNNLQLTPGTSSTIELSSSGSVTLIVSANQSVTWSLQNASGYGVLPAGVSVSPTSGTSTTFTYSAPLQPCNGLPVQLEVLATAATTPPQTALLPVTVAQSPPCLEQEPIVTGGQAYTSCPPAGLVMTAPGTPGLLTQLGAYTQTKISLTGNGIAPYGVPPFTWTQTGSLPSGLLLTPSADTTSVVISGTPDSPGCSSFQLQVTDATGATSCTSTTTASCQPTAFNMVVLPTSLNIKSPAYSFSYDGVPYPPISLQASGGTAPYTWYPDPTANSTLPPGLTLSAIGPGGPSVEIAGTPNAGDSNSFNGAGNGNGQYPTLVYVNDSQLPYPAVGSTTLKMQDYVLSPACSSSTSSPLYLGASGNILVDNYLQGTYAFMLRGFDAQQPTVIAGSITFDGNGNVTSGEEDITQGSTSSQAVAVTGTYTVGIPANNDGDEASYNRGCVTLTSTTGTVTFDFTLGACSNNYTLDGTVTTSGGACGITQGGQAAGVFTSGRLMEADDGTGHSAQMSGVLRAQSTSSFSGGLSGPYAFGLGGWDSAGGHYAMAGSAQASSGSVASVAADIDDAGTLGSQLTGGAGTLGAVDANGRIAATLSVGQANLNLALYMIGASDAFVVTTAPLGANSPVLSGEALTTASSFSTTSLENTHMLAMGGLASPGPDVSIGALTFDGAGDITGTIYEDQAGTLGTTAASGAYTVDGSTGRTAFTAPQVGQTLGAHTFVAYLVPPPLTHNSCSYEAACITGFVVGNDGTAQGGVLEFQTPTYAPPPPFTNRFLSGDFVYGTMEDLDSISAAFEGDVYATPSPSNTTSGSLGNSGTSQLPFYQDSSYGCLQSLCPTFIPADTFQGSYTISTSGTGTFGGGAVVSATNGNVTFYIDESPVNTHPLIVVAEQ